jgi:CheY-like chemotaxis protein
MGAKILSAEGIEVVAVSNGDACVKKLVELDVDMVLADVYMPGLDGYEVCERIKGSPDHVGLPVVLLVGALEPFEPDRIAQVRADGVLRKPFEASAVLETVRPLLRAYIAARTRLKPEPPTERTALIPPPAPTAEQIKRGDTVEIVPPDLDATMRIPPPHGVRDFAEPPVAPPATASAPVAPPAASPAADAPLMAEMAVPVEIPDFPSTMSESYPEAHAAGGAGADFSLPAPAEEYAPGEFAIPDIGESHEESADNAALAGALDTVPSPEPVVVAPEPVVVAPVPVVASTPPAKWVVEPVPVSPEDHARFGEVPKPEVARSAAPPKKREPDAPPDWGELLKSVEGSLGGSISRAAIATAPLPIPVPVAPPAPSVSEAAAPAPSSDLELEIPAEEVPAVPAPPPPPPIDEEELRMAVQLCLESALPGLVDEITAAVLRRLQSPS